MRLRDWWDLWLTVWGLGLIGLASYNAIGKHDYVKATYWLAWACITELGRKR